MLTFEHWKQKNNQNEKTHKDIFRYRRIKRCEILKFSHRILQKYLGLIMFHPCLYSYQLYLKIHMSLVHQGHLFFQLIKLLVRF